MLKINKKKGFSLVELLVGVAVFLVIVVSVYNSYTSIFNVVFTSRSKIDAADLINEELEIIRNMPYSQVGIVGGLPAGVLTQVQTLIRDSNQFTVTTTVRNVDDPFDGTLGGTPNDLSPADHKLVEIAIQCPNCRNFKPISVTTIVSPKNLESASTNGALFIKVFDANGIPVSGASVNVVNNSASPTITINDTTDSNGMLQIVDAPPGVNAYQITVTKAGYSTDGTQSATGGNPNPVKPHATVALQQVTSVSFAIDKLSSFTVTSQSPLCDIVPSMNFTLSGSKLIGTNPNNLKYSQNKVTDGSGRITISGLEWDAYSFAGIDATYDIIGLSPLNPANLSPNSTQAVQLIVAPKNPKTLLVTVRDSVTGLALSDVDVTLSKTSFTSVTKTTGQGFIGQTDWSGGGNQATSTDITKYFSSDGNIETALPAGDLVLKKIFSDYVPSGTLTSSSFDTGSASNFAKILWLPQSQPVAVGTPNVRMQVATNNDGGTWSYTGPDGTASTYYTVANQNLSTINNGNRYLRYKLFLDTASTTFTPDVSDVSFTFTSLCTPPGQVSFSGLVTGAYDLRLSKVGYQIQDVTGVSVANPWQNQDVVMLPN